jgi:hypothetical protein
VSGHTELRRAAPWVLCVVSLCLVALSTFLQWLQPDRLSAEQVDVMAGLVEALGFIGIPVVGALIASRLPANPYGWVWCATGLTYAVSFVVRPLVEAAGGPLWVAWLLEASGFVTNFGLLIFVFLLFPTGRLPTRRWRWLARTVATVCAVLVLAVPFAPAGQPAESGPWTLEGPAGRLLGQAVEVGVGALFALGLIGMSSLAPRFRRAGPLERRQLTWFVYAAALNAVFLVVESLGLIPGTLLWMTVRAALFALVPVAVGVAVLRYRLFEIDRIVSRTVSYALLSATLIGCYLLVVALLRPLLEPLTGSSTLAVAGSTLAVAAVFNPARRRLQEAVDRRFDRARYDAARAVDAFAARLRDQVDLDEVASGLRDTVVATVAPTRVGVWLRVPSGTGGG